ncbi:MAG TPA: ribose 5-phosphate isomerase B [Acidimicrobiales bacterium]|jgi:ribose 5-phosphate isomerase B|nr:ribose 5-phosphate isomerase B [Acidimicrobiales bacterium]
MRIAIGCDHAGFALKSELTDWLADVGHDISDLGAYGTARVDYPDYGAAVGRAVVKGDAQLGVCVCGSGIGIAIAANKIRGVRAAVVHDVTSAMLARRHNDANVICLGERLTGVEVARAAVETFVATGFEGGRHAGRVAKIAQLEQEEEQP